MWIVEQWSNANVKQITRYIFVSYQVWMSSQNLTGCIFSCLKRSYTNIFFGMCLWILYRNEEISFFATASSSINLNVSGTEQNYPQSFKNTTDSSTVFPDPSIRSPALTSFIFLFYFVSLGFDNINNKNEPAEVVTWYESSVHNAQCSTVI